MLIVLQFYVLPPLITLVAYSTALLTPLFLTLVKYTGKTRWGVVAALCLVLTGVRKVTLLLPPMLSAIYCCSDIGGQMPHVRGEELDYSYNGRGPRNILQRLVRRVFFWNICRTIYVRSYYFRFKLIDDLLEFRFIKKNIFCIHGPQSLCPLIPNVPMLVLQLLNHSLHLPGFKELTSTCIPL